MRVPKWLVAGILAVPLMALADDSVQMTPGRWQETFKVTAATLHGKPISPDAFKGKTTFSCVSPDQAHDPRLYFTYVSAGGSCEPPRGTVAGGHVSLTTHCSSGGRRPMDIDLQGSYGRQSYRMTGVARGSSADWPLTMTIVVDGAFQGPCKGDEQ